MPARTVLLVKGRHILVIQDTTSLRDDGDQRSPHLHPAIGVDARVGALPGLVHAVFLSRAGEEKAPHGRRPFAEKESRRWLHATCEAGKLAVAGAASVTAIAGREGDIHEEFAWPASRNGVADPRPPRPCAGGRLAALCLHRKPAAGPCDGGTARP